MTTVSIIGSGNMGTAIGGLVTDGGNTVEFIGHDAPETTINGDVVVLAVPHPAIADVLANHGSKLAGKVVVDITNPLNFETFDSLVVPADSSKAAEIAAQLPDSKVVKAFNTNFGATGRQEGRRPGHCRAGRRRRRRREGGGHLARRGRGRGCEGSRASFPGPASWSRSVSCRSPWPPRARFEWTGGFGIVG